MIEQITRSLTQCTSTKGAKIVFDEGFSLAKGSLVLEPMTLQIVAAAERQLQFNMAAEFSSEHPGTMMPPDFLERSAGKREGYCSKATSAVSEAAFKLGHTTANSDNRSSSRIYGIVESLVDRYAGSQVFRHDCSIVVIDGRKYLFDLTVGQFVGKDGQVGSRFVGPFGSESVPTLTGKHLNEYPVLQKLIEQGYVELTPDNLVQYLQALTTNQSPLYQASIRAKITQESLEHYFKPW